MAVRPVLEWPDPRLKAVATAVEVFDDALMRMVSDLFDTMDSEGGIGLAATQIGVTQRVTVIDLSDPDDRYDGVEGAGSDERMVYINPAFAAAPESTLEATDEGCLSVPNIRIEVKRPTAIHATWQDVTGKAQSAILTGLHATCFQHELDHLDGRLIVDYLTLKERASVRRQYDAERAKSLKYGNAS